MIQDENTRVWVNRIVALLAGALIIFAIMSFTTITPLKDENATLTSQLDEIRNGAVRLLGEATVQFQNKSYDSAKKTLDVLFSEQPTSPEAVEGKKLYAEIEDTVRELNRAWDAASADIRTTWEEMRTAQLRAKLEEDRLLLETNLENTLNTEWEKNKQQIRRDWEKESM